MPGLIEAVRGSGWRRELRQLKDEVKRLAEAQERLALVAEAWLARNYPPQPARDPTDPVVEIGYFDAQVNAEMMDIELRLTKATGQLPTEDEILAEYQRNQPSPATPLGVVS